jgi:hypothetical protein
MPKQSTDVTIDINGYNHRNERSQNKRTRNRQIIGTSEAKQTHIQSSFTDRSKHMHVVV